MITPRETRLLRAPTLGAFQRAIAEAVAGCGAASPAAAVPTSTRAATYGPPTSSDTTQAAAVLTPTREATLQLRRTLDAAGVDSGRAALVTRDEWYDWLRDRMGPGPPLLTPVEREVVAGAAAADAAAGGSAPPFRLRPGIVAALLAFYDQLRRRRRSVDAFERLLVEELEPSAELDRGARRLLLQTRFLVAAFRAYDRRLDALGGLDEHRLRERLLAADGIAALSEIVVTVPDRVAHAAGLYAADFDLLARLPRLARVTLIATDAVLDSGYRERLEDLLPGLVERRVEPAARRAPAIVVPDAGGDRPYFVWRDREEELRAIARRVRRAVAAGARPPASAAVVVRRPLPYVYLAPSVCGALDLPVRTPDLTLRLTGGEVRSVRVDGRPLARAPNRAALLTDTPNGNFDWARGVHCKRDFGIGRSTPRPRRPPHGGSGTGVSVSRVGRHDGEPTDTGGHPPRRRPWRLTRGCERAIHRRRRRACVHALLEHCTAPAPRTAHGRALLADPGRWRQRAPTTASPDR